MRSSKIKYFIPVIIMLLSVACETDVDLVNAPVFKQRLVITSFISPSDNISFFRVTSNIKMYGELHTEEPLGLLSGTISDGVNEVTLDTCNTGLKLNHEKMQIQYGKSYKLKVSSENGLKAEAECTIPDKKNFVMEIDTFSVLNEDQYSPYQNIYRSLNLKVKISDLPGEENFYRIFGTFRGYSPHYTMSGYMSFDNEFISDKGMDGEKIASNMSEYLGHLYSSAKDSLFVNIYLYNTEKSYYLFHKSLKDYNDGENPFSEASPVYSNINGGFGIFTSYTIDSLVVRLR